MESFARARSAAAAAASATASQVACSRRPRVSLRPPPVIQWLHAGEADRNVELSVAPGAAEAVADQDRGRRAAAAVAIDQDGAQALADPPGRGVGVAREQHEHVGAGAVRGIDAGVGADEAVACAADENSSLGAQDLRGLVEHHLDRARVLALTAFGGDPGSELARAGASVARRRARRRASLGLRDGLVCDRQHLPRAERLISERRDDQRGEIIPAFSSGMRRRCVLERPRHCGGRFRPRSPSGSVLARAARASTACVLGASARWPRARSAIGSARNAARSAPVSMSSSSDAGRSTRQATPAASASAR